MPFRISQLAKIGRLAELAAGGVLTVAKEHDEQILPVAIKLFGQFVWIPEHKADRYFERLAAAMRALKGVPVPALDIGPNHLNHTGDALRRGIRAVGYPAAQ